ncbi:MAG: gfo/Idh/MocA family oxidoreductase, partial [Alphaproteobacteria bacterium]|nr:gfo/Idh/MocA family oxidoreductase [Alphaproteobacteria bacterium]
EDYASATLTLESGAAIQLACSWRVSAGFDAVISAAFYGSEGGAALRNVNGSFYDFTAERYRGVSREPLSVPPDAWGGRAAADWARRLSEGQRFDASSERLIDVARALDAIYGR